METNQLPKVFCLDTNVLLYDSESLFAFDDNIVVIPLVVLEELDTKKSRMDDVGQNARKVSRHLDKLRKQGSLSDGVALKNGGTIRITKRLDISDDMPEEILDNPIADNSTPEGREKNRRVEIKVEGVQPKQ